MQEKEQEEEACLAKKSCSSVPQSSRNRQGKRV